MIELENLAFYEGFNYARVFKISDYLNTSGFWLMFFKNGSPSGLAENNIAYSRYSPQLMSAVQQTIKEQSNVSSIDEIISRWVKVLDLRDKETEEHTARVSSIAVELARKYGLKETDIESIRRGALLHDIGKIVIPNEILHKESALSEEEWQIMRLHPTIAKELLSNLNLPEDVLNIPLYHHERWSGTGYPLGLVREEIPLPARIFAVADVWDAINSDRPYRPRFSKEQARKYIIENTGVEFDPDVVRCFFDL
jgi:putative nucleotidyltransferase with HDIG domain